LTRNQSGDGDLCRGHLHKIFHAIGYYVAEVYIVTFSRNEIELAKNAQYEDLAGKTRSLTTKDIDQILGEPTWARRAVSHDRQQIPAW
jgi:hypothetical protein